MGGYNSYSAPTKEEKTFEIFKKSTYFFIKHKILSKDTKVILSELMLDHHAPLRSHDISAPRRWLLKEESQRNTLGI